MVVLAPHQTDPRSMRDVWWVRHMSRVTGAIALAVLIALPLVITLASSQFLYSRVLLFARSRSRSRADRLGRPAVARPVRVRRPRRVHDRGAAHRRHPLRVRDPRRRHRGRPRRHRDRAPGAPGQGPVPGGHDARVRDRHAAVAAVPLVVPRRHHRCDPAPCAPRSGSTCATSAPTTTCAWRHW